MGNLLKAGKRGHMPQKRGILRGNDAILGLKSGVTSWEGDKKGDRPKKEGFGVKRGDFGAKKWVTSGEGAKTGRPQKTGVLR